MKRPIAWWTAAAFSRTHRSADAPRRSHANLKAELARANICTAEEMAKANGVSPGMFRSALRREELPWHGRYDRWDVVCGSPEHADMERVMRDMIAR